MDEQADTEHSRTRAQTQAQAQAQAQAEAETEAEAEAEAEVQAQAQSQSQQSQEMAVPMVIPRPEERKRVKVYELRESDWYDRGTGMCFAETNEDEPMIIVESEDRPGTMLLETKVLKKDVYQKQQETLIVWTDLNGTDMALSFQEAEGCASIWNFVNTVQTYFRNANQDDSVSEDALDEYTSSVTLPPPTLGNLAEIERLIQSASSPMQSRDMLSRDMLSKYLLQKNYIAKLVPLVSEAEDFESLEDLHRLCNIMKMIILLNDNAIVEAVVSDELVEGVIGALEYDPDFPTHKANHRQYLNDRNRYKEVVPIQDPMILRKIRCTWRLQYLKDVVLARIIDDPTFSVLNSLIFFNQVAIVQHLQHNTTFMDELFALFRKDNRSPENVKKKEDAVRFLYQCTTVAKNLQPPGRSALYLDFVDHGVFDAIAFAVSHPKSTYRATGVDILMSFLDHDQGTMREYMLLFKHGVSSVNESTMGPLEGTSHEKEDQTDSQRTAKGYDEDSNARDSKSQASELSDSNDGYADSPRLLTDILIDLLHVEPDLGVKMQLSDSIKVLLEPIWFFTEPVGRPLTTEEIRRVRKAESMQAGRLGGAGIDSALDALIMRRRFDLAMIRLFAPLKKLRDMDLSQLTFQQAAMYEHLLDILSCFLRSHVFWGKRFMYSQRLTPRIAEMLDAPQKHLKLAALQTFRALLHLNDTFYFGEMSRNNVYGKLLQIITDTMPRDNLLSSACLELFESVTRHPGNQNALVKPVILYLGENYRSTLRRITYVETFRKILIRYDRLQGYSEPLDLSHLTSDDTNAADTDVEGGVPGGPRVVAGGQSGYVGLREDREQDEYFEADDDEPEEEQVGQQRLATVHAHPAPMTSSSSMKPLVDYPDDDEDEDDEDTNNEGIREIGERQGKLQSQQQPRQGLRRSTEQGSSPVNTPSTSPQSQQSSEGSGTPTTSPALAAVTQDEQFAAIARGLAEKRRREEDDEDDELVKLSGNAKKRTASGAGVTSSASLGQGGDNKASSDQGAKLGAETHSTSTARRNKAISFSPLGGAPRPLKPGELSGKQQSLSQSHAKRRSDSTDNESEGNTAKKIHFSIGDRQTSPKPSMEGKEEHDGRDNRGNESNEDEDEDEHADESATAEPIESSDEQEAEERESISPSSQDAVRKMEESIVAAGGDGTK